MPGLEVGRPETTWTVVWEETAALLLSSSALPWEPPEYCGPRVWLQPKPTVIHWRLKEGTSVDSVQDLVGAEDHPGLHETLSQTVNRNAVRMPLPEADAGLLSRV